MKSSKLTLVFAMLLPILVCVGCSDKSNNGSDDIPENLVDIWWYESATINEVPVLSYSELAFDESALTASLTFTANGTWSTAEYAEGSEPIYTRSGTFTVDGNTMDYRVTVDDGTPVDPAEEFSMDFVVSGDDLTMTATEVVMEETITIVVNYTRED